MPASLSHIQGRRAASDPLRRWIVLALVSTSLVALCDVAVAQTIGAGGEAEHGLLAFGRVMLALLVVLVAFWGFAMVLRRVQRPMAGGARHLRVLAALPVGPRDRVLLLQIGDEQVAVGASPQGLRTLHVLARPVEIEAPRDDGGFRNALKASLRSETTA